MAAGMLAAWRTHLRRASFIVAEKAARLAACQETRARLKLPRQRSAPCAPRRHDVHSIYEGGKIAWTRRTSSLLSKEQDNMVTCRGAALADCTTARLHSVLIE